LQRLSRVWVVGCHAKAKSCVFLATVIEANLEVLSLKTISWGVVTFILALYVVTSAVIAPMLYTTRLTLVFEP
jgi:hypothetical protein